MNTYEQMREALNNVGNAAAWIAESCNDQQTAKYMNDIIAIVQSAISAPARQCDVGSEEEQSRRYEAFCEAHHMQCDKVCSACPCSKKSGVSCELYWAQMPYEKQEVGTT